MNGRLVGLVAEEVVDGGLVELEVFDVAFAEETLHEFQLGMLELLNLGFDTVVDDEFIDEDGLSLTDAVATVGGLAFDGGVPPRVVVDDAVGGGEVEAGAAGAQADEEQRAGTGLELLHELGAVGGGASEQEEVVALGGEFATNEIEHAGKLREDEGAAAPGAEIGHEFHQGGELSGVVQAVGHVAIRVEQAGIAADLAEPQETGEDLQA